MTVSTTREEDFGAGAVAFGTATGATALGDESTNTAVVAGLTAEAGVELETAGITTAAFLATFLTGAFLATTFLAAAFFAGAFFATTFLAGDFLANQRARFYADINNLKLLTNEVHLEKRAKKG